MSSEQQGRAGDSREGGSGDGSGVEAIPPRGGAAFLLAQIGAHAAGRFGERVAGLGLSPADVGLLRMIATRPGRSQRALATDLGVVPSRVVALIDHLDGKGLVERRRGVEDRRHHELHLSPEGYRILGEVRQVATEHESDICAGLDEAQRAELISLLELVATRQGLTPGVHPGYREPAKRGRPASGG
ncbi:hypothetical protein GCM10009665_15590 [Kitasatospora nipponensis]|uniref:HTH marR-type domain-containing protein n=1 Tax=Kitasatospora nipponensis TaxID=258049 RepID=A0ABP4GI57_9ACTN